MIYKAPTFNYYDQNKKNKVFEMIKKFKPVKFTTFFNEGNYLFTPYAPEKYSAIIILDDGKGNELHVRGCTCGYYGAGPHCTREILKYFSFNEKAAERLAFKNKSIFFEIDESLKYVNGSLKTEFFFDNQVKCNNDILINVPYKEIFIFHIKDHLSSLMKILDKMESLKMRLCKVEYYIGYNSMNRRNFDFPNPYYVFPNSSSVHGPYFSIHTDKITLTCFVNKDCSVAIMNIINNLLFGEELFHDVLYDVCCTADDKRFLTFPLSIMEYIKAVLNHLGEKEYYKQYNISESDERSIYFNHEQPFC